MNAIILIVIGIVLIVFNVKAINNQKKSFAGILNDKQGNVKDYEIEITKLREEFSNTILELQKEIEQLKAKLKINDDIMVSSDDSENTVKSSNGVKVNEIKKLLDSGMSIDNICKELDMGKGEVLLVKELYVK